MASSLNGTGLTFSTGATLNSPPVTSIATGNGLSGGTITTTGTLALAAPSYNSVGSYVWGIFLNAYTNQTYTSGNNYSAGTGTQNVQSASLISDGGSFSITYANNLSGTWKYMGPTQTVSGAYFYAYGLFVRVA